MTLGADSVVVNGQLVTTPQGYQYNPPSFGPQTIGVPNVSPSYPPFGGAPMSSATPGSESVGGYGTAGNNSVVAQIAGQHPWNLRTSPLVWAVGGLILSLVLLRAVHWRETILEGGEHARIGPVGERAEAEA